MKEFSKEIIEIDGSEYSLFLNRKGIVAFETYSQKESEKIKEITKEISQYKDEVLDEISDEVNPFESNDVNSKNDILERTEEANRNLYKKLYWIMLYSEHKLSITKASELYEKACEEYGEEQIIALADQMVEDANKNKVNKDNLKNLPALRPRN